MSLHSSMHSSQMYTDGPAISFFTCFCDLPQKLHFTRSLPSPNLAIAWSLPRSPAASGHAGRDGHGGELTGGEDVVDQAVVLGLGRGEDEVPVGVAVDPLDRLAGVVG